MIYGDFFQTYEGAKNEMTQMTMNAIILGTSSNLQGGTHCFIFFSGRVLCRTWKNIEIHKMPQSAISQTNYTVKQQKSANRLNFGDSQSMIDRAISMGVMSDLNDDQE